jgi:stringent starvation protein B
VQVDETVQVPREYVKNNEIVLNISFDATSSLKLGNDFIEFKARFAGSAREIIVPISRVIAIYARENGQGMAFPSPTSSPVSGAGSALGLTGSASSLIEVKDGPGDGRMQLVPDSQTIGNSTARTEDSPDPPKTPKGGRPSLKRVK